MSFWSGLASGVDSFFGAASNALNSGTKWLVDTADAVIDDTIHFYDRAKERFDKDLELFKQHYPTAGSAETSTPTEPESFSEDMDPVDFANAIQEEMQDAAFQQQDAAQGSADRAMEFEHNEAALLRDWQKQMRLSYYPDLVKSLQESGLNPALAYSGASISSPSGASGSGSAANMMMANTYNQNVSLDESLSKRQRDAQIWSAVISAIFGAASRASSAAIYGTIAAK